MIALSIAASDQISVREIMISETLRLVVGVVDHRESSCDDRVWDDEEPEVAAVRDWL
jgi:hypothetical protein